MYTKEQIQIEVSTSELEDEIQKVTVEMIAAACHQQNRTYCQMIGDDSQVNWADAPAWQRESAVEGIRSVLKNPDLAATHESWAAFKAADGWVYGEVKDAEAKTHPCMVPYSDLPEEQKKKDELYVDMVQQLALEAGLISLKS